MPLRFQEGKKKTFKFVLHYESVEPAENWEDFVLLSRKRLDYFLSELKLISNLKTQQKNWIMAAFWLKDNSRGHVTQELIEIALFLLHCASAIEN